jgi:uncharacterized protein (TIRG00374 family)
MGGPAALLKTGIKCTVSLLLLVGLLLVYGSDEMTATWRNVSIADILLIICFSTIGLAILAKRFQQVLTAGGITQAWSAVFSLQLMGLTMNQFFPGLFGGDLLRAAFFMPHYETKKGFLTAAVLFERINGLLVMSCIASLGCIYMPAEYARFFLLTMALLLMVGFLFFCFTLFRMRSPAGIKGRLYKWIRRCQEIGDILLTLFRNPSLFARTFVFSSFSQIMTILIYWHLLRATDIRLPFPAIAAVVAFAWLVSMVPVSLNGLGVRESGFMFGLASFGVSKGVALSISLTALLPVLLHALLGGVLLGMNYSRIVELRKLFGR